ncbi:MAG TPA: DUF3800 domain-containing protein, partial [Amphiplicatus sp.]|nr:DUF3800 domain-containing protein [Amphiplicatus sp.]
YLLHEAPRFSALKFDTFGHDAVVFHSRKIRKRLGPFQILQDDEKRARFLTQVSSFFENSKATLIAAAIDKRRLTKRYARPDDPYDIALLFCLERLFLCLKDRGISDETITCIFEERGEKEDSKLAITFQEIVAGANQCGPLPFKMVFASKLANMPGLQIADLAAYPIARKTISPTGENRAFEALEGLFRTSPSGKYLGWGLKVFP